MANDVVLNLKITGDGKGGEAAIKAVVESLKNLGIEAGKTNQKVAAGGGFDAFGASAKAALMNVAAMMAAAIGVSQFLELGLASLDNARALGEFSKEAGISVEALSVFQYQARKANLDIGDLRHAFNSMAVAMKNASEDTGGVRQTLHDIGIDWKTLMDLPLDQQIQKVTTAMSGFTDSQQKTIAAMTFLGARGTQLIGPLSKLAGDGFAKVSVEAERAGGIMREKDVRAAEELQRATVSLKTQTTALSQSLFQGLIPALGQSVDSLNDMTGSTKALRGVFGSVGSFAGDVFKGLALLLDSVASGIDIIVFATFKMVTTIGPVIKKAFSGDFLGAGEELQKMQGSIKDFVSQIDKDSLKLRSSLFGTPAQVAGSAGDARDEAIKQLRITESLLRKEGIAAAPFDTTGVETSKIVAQNDALNATLKKKLVLHQDLMAATRKAAMDRRLATLDYENALVKEKTDQQIAAATATYAQGKMSVDAFYAARRDALATASAAELKDAAGKVTALQDALSTANATERIGIIGEIGKAQQAVDLLHIQQQGKVAALTADELAERQKLAVAQSEFQATMDEQQGKAFELAMARIKAQADAMRIELGKQPGATPESAKAQADAFRAAAENKATIDETERRANVVADDIASNEVRLQQLVQLGLKSENGAALEQKKFIEDRIGGINGFIDALTALKTIATDDATKKGIQDIIDKMNGLKVTAATTLTQMQQFGVGTLKGAYTAVSQFFSEASDGAHTFGQAIGDAARSFLSAVSQMIISILAMQAVVVVARKLGVPDTVIKAAGLLLRAQGGPVPGSGSGDTVPAMLTPGEFVLNRRMVDAFGGITELERLRLSMSGRIGPLVRGGVPYFAGGGLVPAGGMMDALAQENVTRVIIEAHPDLVVRQIESGPGARAIIRAMGRNRNSANDALGRG